MYHQDLEYYIKKFRMDLQEAVFDKEVFREELRTQKLKVAKLEEQNLETSKIRQELKDSRTMVHAKDIENPEVWNATPEVLKDVTRDFASIEMIWQKNLRRTSMIRRSHRRQDQDFKSLSTLKIFDL